MRARVGQRGTTLNELIVVITILGMLAAFAIPRFASLEVEARRSSTQALEGSLRSGAALAHALWLAQESPVSIDMDEQTIDIVNGYPDRDTIVDTVADTSGFTYSPETGVFAKTDAPGVCTITYEEAPANGVPTITAALGGC